MMTVFQSTYKYHPYLIICLCFKLSSSNNLFLAGGSVIKPENFNSFELTSTNHNHSGHDCTRIHCWQTGRSQSPSFSTAHSQKHLSDSPLANLLTSKAETTFSSSPPTETNKKGGGKENSMVGGRAHPFSRHKVEYCLSCTWSCSNFTVLV